MNPGTNFADEPKTRALPSGQQEDEPPNQEASQAMVAAVQPVVLLAEPESADFLGRA